MKNGKGIRLTFLPSELREIYALIGGKVGELTDRNAISDGRPSEISKQVADLKMAQDRIAAALREKETEQTDGL